MKSLLLLSLAVPLLGLVILMPATGGAMEASLYRIASYVAGGCLIAWAGLVLAALKYYGWRGLHVLWTSPIVLMACFLLFLGPACGCGDFETVGSTVSDPQAPKP
ncbi:MAG TPA: hypothetical protein VKS60_20830 [Stellaceae bacterium]|nr:hypothetical protein [Stellaceae bacterium]